MDGAQRGVSLWLAPTAVGCCVITPSRGPPVVPLHHTPCRRAAPRRALPGAHAWTHLQCMRRTWHAGAKPLLFVGGATPPLLPSRRCLTAAVTDHTVSALAAAGYGAWRPQQRCGVAPAGSLAKAAIASGRLLRHSASRRAPLCGCQQQQCKRGQCCHGCESVAAEPACGAGCPVGCGQQQQQWQWCAARATACFASGAHGRACGVSSATCALEPGRGGAR